jgi:XapX domain-containing protein
MNFIISLAMGLVVGIVYGLSGVRSPAPPLVALVGLLGMVLGGQAVAMAKSHYYLAQDLQKPAPDSTSDIDAGRKTDQQ